MLELLSHPVGWPAVIEAVRYQGGGPLTRFRSSDLSAETRRLSGRALTPLGGENAKAEGFDVLSRISEKPKTKRRNPSCGLR